MGVGKLPVMAYQQKRKQAGPISGAGNANYYLPVAIVLFSGFLDFELTTGGNR